MARERASWRRNLGTRIVAILLGVSCTSATIGSIVDYRTAERTAREELLEHGHSLARQAALFCPDAVVETDLTLLETYVHDLVSTERSAAFALVYRADGTQLAGYPRGASPVHNAITLLVAEPIFVERGGPELGTFYLGLSLGPMQEALRARTARLLVNSSVGFLAVGVVLWFVLRFVVVRPLRRLDAEAQRLGRGDLEAPLPAFGGTELGRLGRTLDEMRENLRQSQVSLAEQNRRLLELDRMKSQFLANVSHEMRTPLTSILGEGENLVDASSSAAERAESTELIQRNGARLLELVDRLLDLAKMESGNLLIEKRSCCPAEVIAAACEPFRAAAAAKKLALHVHLDGLGETAVVTDPVRLRQMVGNVLDNAVKFTDAGDVTVTASLSAAAPHRLSVVVRDTGTGMSSQFLAMGIGAFRQEDGSMTRRHGGSGLGLYMTRQIARSLDGDVHVVSEEGRGTTVEITIRVEVAGALSPAPEATPPGRVLVVDDARDNQHLLKTMLTKLGHTVELADNGRAAIERMRASRAGAPFDLVIMDLQMPELDGISAIRELRALGFDVPIVSLTAHGLADDRQRCLDAGASGYETKPITRKRLTEVVAAHMRAGRAS